MLLVTNVDVACMPVVDGVRYGGRVAVDAPDVAGVSSGVEDVGEE